MLLVNMNEKYKPVLTLLPVLAALCSLIILHYLMFLLPVQAQDACNSVIMQHACCFTWVPQKDSENMNNRVILMQQSVKVS